MEILLSQQSALLPLLLSQAKLKQFSSIAEVRRRGHRIPRCAHLPHGASPFVKFYKHHNEQLLITFMGLDFPTFTYLLNKFEPLYYRYSLYSRNDKIIKLQNRRALGGRPWPLDAVSYLGLVLGYTRTRGSDSFMMHLVGNYTWVTIAFKIICWVFFFTRTIRGSMHSLQMIFGLTHWHILFFVYFWNFHWGCY